MMRRTVAALALSAAAATGLSAQQTSFEAGFAGYTGFGNYGLSGPEAVNVAPVDGSWMAVVRTGPSGTYGGLQSGAFSVSGGETLSMWLNYISRESEYTQFNDAAVAWIYDLDTSVQTYLYYSDTNWSGGSYDVYENGNGAYRQRGWTYASHTFSGAGNYVLGFEAFDNGDDLVDSGLLIDDIRLNDGTVTPEPITMTLLGTGLAGVAAARRRRKTA